MLHGISRPESTRPNNPDDEFRPTRCSRQVYGFFASVLGLVSWLQLSAQLMLVAAEVNVVKATRLWPRSIVQPPLVEADRRTLDLIARQEERRPEQSVTSSWPRAGDPAERW